MNISISTERYRKTEATTLHVRGMLDGKFHSITALYSPNSIPIALKEWRGPATRLDYDGLSEVDCGLVNSFIPVKTTVYVVDDPEEIQNRVLKVIASYVSEQVDAIFGEQGA